MLAAIGLARDDVYIANVLKCRPPGNRPPAPEEVATCRPFLAEQLRLLEPELILVLGNHAARAVLGADRGITSLRGRIHRAPDGRAVLPTFHPAYLLRNPDAKRDAWLDLQLVARTLGLRLPGRPSDPGPPAPSA
jgi:DNA polymerase